MRLRSFLRMALLALCVLGTLAIVSLAINAFGSPSSGGGIPTERDGSILSNLHLWPFSRRERNLVTIIIENHEDARPHQQGLSDALLILEFPVEGFISRFAAVFDVNDLPDQIGPVRSLRPYFVDVVKPLHSLILFAGGSPEAFDRLSATTLTGINGLAHPKEFTRDDEIPAPHNLFLAGEDAVSFSDEAAEQKIPWPPYDTGAQRSTSGALSIFLNFYNPTHDVRYIFERLGGRYARENGGQVSDAKPRNVLVLAIPIAGIGEHGRLSIPLEGSGEALLFRDGTVTRGRWRKPTDDTWFSFVDTDGEPLVFAVGQTWITVLPDLERVTWSTDLMSPETR